MDDRAALVVATTRMMGNGPDVLLKGGGTPFEGLNCRVRTPAPIRLNACASFALQDRQP